MSPNSIEYITFNVSELIQIMASLSTHSLVCKNNICEQSNGCNNNKDHSKPFKTGSVITPILPVRTLRLGLVGAAIGHFPKEDYANTERIR